MSNDWIEPALALFRKACELPPADQVSFLDGACGPDTELRRHVAAMLARDAVEDAARNDGAARHPVRGALSRLVEQAAAEAAGEALIPAHVGGYRIVRLIAHGGMGVVYEAQQEHPQRRVAIKIARTGGSTDEERRRFELEVQLLARLRHPGIAQVFDAGTTSPEDGGRPYFVMELVEGRSLMDHAQAHLPTARERIELMVRVCDAVGFAHRSGVIHRDLKPDNVLIDAGGQPRVLDFGVAKVEAAGGFGAATLRTEAGRVIGTLGYMAPEQLGGQTADLGPEADVYSLGVMLYQLLSGRLPHELDAASLTKALAVVATTDAPLLGVVRPEHRGDVEAVVAKALEKDARHRYPDAPALKADLERYLRGEPIVARPAGPLRRVTKWARRNPALATAALGLFLALATAAAILLVKNQEVRSALADYGRLEDARRLEEARSEAAKLWPALPSLVDGLDAWLGRYGALAHRDRIDDHRAAVDRIRREGGSRQGDTWTFAKEPLQWQHDVLVELVRDLEAFASAAGLRAQVEARRQLASTIHERTVKGRQGDWRAAKTRVLANEKYRGLTLEPQVGLIPLGQNPVTGLEEFLHLETHAGVVPPAGQGARIALSPGEDTGLVLVLIPGGTFWMGAQKEDPQGNHYDPAAIVGWELHYEVHDFEPYFLSKYEMTQGQWQRFVGDNPSVEPRSARKPVNLVSWRECDEVLRRLGLVLPSEEQWEHAARGGNEKDAWWTGADERSLQGAENLTDQTSLKRIAAWYPEKEGVTPADWFDATKQQRFDAGDHGPAPVGSYRANGFGLYDVSGNLSEWCRKATRMPREPAARSDRDHANRSGDLTADPHYNIVRGGSYKGGVREARLARRDDSPAVLAADTIGLRPARGIER